MHDLENKKRKCIDDLKDSTTLKIFMKVNVYDPENVQKGRLMLLNLAEDLKEYAKVLVSPGTKEENKNKSSKKPTLEDVKKAAEEQAFVSIGKNAVDDDDLEDDSFNDDGDR